MRNSRGLVDTVPCSWAANGDRSLKRPVDGGSIQFTEGMLSN